MNVIGSPAPADDSRARAPSIGVAGFVLAIVGLFLPLVAIAGLVLATLGAAKAKAEGLPSRLCWAGVVIGSLACMGWFALFIQWVATPAPR